MSGDGLKWCWCDSNNLDDALEKMQACLDRAAESLIPPEVDEEKLKQIAKQCALAWSLWVTLPNERL